MCSKLILGVIAAVFLLVNVQCTNSLGDILNLLGQPSSNNVDGFRCGSGEGGEGEL